MTSKLALLFFARMSGFFLLSPLFSRLAVPSFVRLGLALACSAFVFSPLLVHLTLPTLSLPFFLLLCVKELMIGYGIGLLFALLIEAAALAGQFVGTLMGFSATELLDPRANSEHPMLGRAYALLIMTLFLSLDLHHVLLRFLSVSFETFPLHTFPKLNLLEFVEMSGLLFHIALDFAFIPLVLLMSLLTLYAILARFFPIFWVGFPLAQLIGFGAIALSLSLFTPILEKGFALFIEVGKKVFFQL